MNSSLAWLSVAFSDAFNNLWGVRHRTALALLGIAVGNAAVIALINIGQNAATESIKQFQSMGTNLLVVQKGLSRTQSATLFKQEYVADLSKSIKTISELAPLSAAFGKVRVRKTAMDTSILGVTPDIFSIAGLKLYQGRQLTVFDDRETFAIIGFDLANSLNVKIGEKIHVDDYTFTLIGILERSPVNPMITADFNISVLIPISTTKYVIASDGQLSSVLVKGVENVDPAEIAKEISTHFAHSKTAQHLQVQSAQQLIEGARKQSQLFTFLLAGIGAISLFVGGIGVMNVMLTGIAERQREIGVRMAIGARRRDVLLMMLIEATSLSLLGGTIGLILGELVAWGFAKFSGWEFTAFLLSIPLGLGMSIMVGIFFGIYPALKASRMSPIDALRSE